MLDLYVKNDIIHSLSIKERLNVFKKNKHEFKSDLKNIEMWKQSNTLVNNKLFVKILENEDVSELEFNYAIKELDDKDRFELYEEIKNTELYSLLSNIINVFKVEEKEFSKYDVDYDLPYTIRIFIFYFVHNINYFSLVLRNIEMCREAIDDLINTLANELLKCASRSINHEFYQCCEKGLLSEDTEEEKFKEFIKKKFSNLNDIFEFYLKYATLTRILIIKTNDFINNLKESLFRLDCNLVEIENTFKVKVKNQMIKEILLGNGSQLHGKSVMQFVFENDVKVVYKPGDFSILEKYLEFIKWFNDKSNLLDLYINNIIYKDDYIFEKAIDHKSCDEESEIINFYKRYGQIIAIIYFLCGSDIHVENLIASGEYPCIVDLETLLQSVSKLNFENKASMEAKKHIANSVSFSALLPFKVYGSELDTAVDISALSGYEQIISDKVVSPGTLGKEQLKYEYGNSFIYNYNIPKLNDEYVNYKNYSNHIIESFRDTCMFIMESKDFLLDGFIDIFKDTRVRNILRSSYHYAILLDYSYNPEFTSDFLNREKLMGNLWAYPYEDMRVIKYEVSDMIFDYIPVFYSLSDSRDLITSEGVIIKDYFDESGLDRVKNRINNISKDEIEKQISYMVVSFGLYEEKIKENREKRYDLKKSLYITNNESYNYLEESLNIAEYMKDNVIYSKSKKTVTWIDVILNINNEWEIAPLESSMYQGLTGIASYFLQLYKATGKYYALYKKIIKSAFDKAGVIQQKQVHFNNKFALVYPLLNEYLYTKDNNIVAKLDNLFQFYFKGIDDCFSSDGMYFERGWLKLIQIALNCFDVLKNERYLELIDLVGKKIIKSLETKKIEDIKSGISSGASGISMIFFKLWFYLKESVYKDKAIEILNHERKIYDFKDATWSSGSAGIGMSRLEISKYYHDEIIQREIEKSLDIAINSDLVDDSLSYGNLGNIDFLISYYISTGKEEILKIAKEKFDNVIYVKNQLGSYGISSIPGFETLNIYKGLSGIGYELLRLDNPHDVPSILTVNI